MVFKKLKANLGLGGGAQVETNLHDSDVRPGGSVRGTMLLTPGEEGQRIKYIELALQARVEVETDDGEYDANQVFHKHKLLEDLELKPGSGPESYDFEMSIPIETPFNVVSGQELHKVQVGVRTELEIARARDSTDVDPIRVHALPVHEAVLQAVSRLGFRFAGSDLERGRIAGSPLGFYQEVEFHASPRFRGINQLEVTFITTEGGTQVILEADRKGGFLSEGGDSSGRLSVANHPGPELDSQLEAAIQHLGRSRGLFG